MLEILKSSKNMQTRKAENEVRKTIPKGEVSCASLDMIIHFIESYKTGKNC